MGNAKCRICWKEEGRHKIKRGMICSHCLSRFPASVQKEAGQFTRGELVRLKKRMVEPETLVEAGMLGVGQHMISLNGKAIMLKNLKKIRLNFHPVRPGRDYGTVIGRITVVAELIHPHILIEEPLLLEDVPVFYRIDKREITYFYAYSLELLADMIQECLDGLTCDMMPYLEKFERFMNDYRWKEAEKERKQRARENKEREDREREKQSRKKTPEDKESDILRKARRMFQVEKQYTKKELKEKRRILLKKYHPDAGGSEEMAKEINMAYDLLSRNLAS